MLSSSKHVYCFTSFDKLTMILFDKLTMICRSWVVSLERKGRDTLSALLGSFFPPVKILPMQAGQELRTKSAPKILLIRTHQGLGDLICATPVLRILQEALPSCQLHFMASAYNSPAVETNPRVAKLWIWDKKRALHPGWLIRFIRALRQEHFDAVLVLSANIASWTAVLVGWLTGSQRLIGYDTRAYYGGANWSRWLYNVEAPLISEKMPEAERFAGLTRALGFPESPEPEFYPSDEARRHTGEFRRSMNLPARGGIGLFLGGNPDRPDRLWSLDRWVELAQRLSRRVEGPLIVIAPPESHISGSGAGEPGVADQFHKRMSVPLPVFRHPALGHLGSWVASLDLLICPDGGVLHLASAVGTPTIGLFLGTDPVVWKPAVSFVHALVNPTVSDVLDLACQIYENHKTAKK